MASQIFVADKTPITTKIGEWSVTNVGALKDALPIQIGPFSLLLEDGVCVTGKKIHGIGPDERTTHHSTVDLNCKMIREESHMSKCSPALSPPKIT